MQCRNIAAQLGRLKDELAKYDATVLIIGGGASKGAKRIAKTYNLPYPVLADEDRAIYMQYGLDKAMLIIQRSGSLLVDKLGKLRYIQSGANPLTSVVQSDLMQAIKQVASDGSN